MIRPEFDTYVYLVNFPPQISEAVTPNADGTYTIYIDEKLPEHKRVEKYWHAVAHIMNNDFEKHGDVNLIEYNAHAEGSA